MFTGGPASFSRPLFWKRRGNDDQRPLRRRLLVAAEHGRAGREIQVYTYRGSEVAASHGSSRCVGEPAAGGGREKAKSNTGSAGSAVLMNRDWINKRP